jgi:hypothetical protein
VEKDKIKKISCSYDSDDMRAYCVVSSELEYEIFPYI